MPQPLEGERPRFVQTSEFDPSSVHTFSFCQPFLDFIFDLYGEPRLRTQFSSSSYHCASRFFSLKGYVWARVQSPLDSRRASFCCPQLMEGNPVRHPAVVMKTCKEPCSTCARDTFRRIGRSGGRTGGFKVTSDCVVRKMRADLTSGRLPSASFLYPHCRTRH